jgi:hypothetical protein
VRRERLVKGNNTVLVVIGTVIVMLLVFLVFGGGRMMGFGVSAGHGGMMSWWR